MSNHPIYTITNPLLATLTLRLRDQKTNSRLFRKTIRQITTQMLGSVSCHLPTSKQTVITPMHTKAHADVLSEEIVLYTILRAGLAMSDVVFEWFENVVVNYHFGFVRDQTTHQPHYYYSNHPAQQKKRTAIVVDPMIASGHSLKAALDHLKNTQWQQIIVMGIIATHEGLDYVLHNCDRTKIFVVAIDEELDENKYIVPGLGDAGDRFFQTF